MVLVLVVMLVVVIVLLVLSDGVSGISTGADAAGGDDGNGPQWW